MISEQLKVIIYAIQIVQQINNSTNKKTFKKNCLIQKFFGGDVKSMLH
jgi:hypothetical protein